MNKELNIQIQWPNGTMLPVLTRSSSTGAELKRLLRFACTTKEELILYHNGVALDLDLSLDEQIIKNNDIINAVISKKKNPEQEALSKKIRELVYEAAKINDQHLNSMELSPNIPKSHKQISTDESSEYFEDCPSIQTRPSLISTDPLPPFWNSSNNSIGNDT